MNKGFLVSIAAAFCLLMGCGDGNVVIQEDPDVQFKKDSAEMFEYLTMSGFMENEIGNTENGIRYVILDSGSMLAIDESDLVEFNYLGKTLGDTIFDTSIKEVGDSLRVHYEENPYISDGDTISVFTNTSFAPILVTYSGSGWTIPTGQGGFIPGFAEGITATFRHLRVGGKALIVIPSGRAYGRNGSGVFIGSNRPIAFELYPVKVTKQL